MGHKRNQSICPHCSLGCGVNIKQAAPGKLSLEGRETYPVNQGSLCQAGVAMHEQEMSLKDRLLYPSVKDGDGVQQAVSWETALDFMADAVKRVQWEHGNDAVGFYGSDKSLIEEDYLVQKITRGFLRTENFAYDAGSDSTHPYLGFKAVFGEALPPAAYEDLEHCNCFLIAVDDLSQISPLLWQRIYKRKLLDPKVKLIVVGSQFDERPSGTDMYFQVRPGSESILFQAIASTLFDQGWVDQTFLTQFCEGEPAYRAHLGFLSLRERAKKCGVSEEDIKMVAEWIGESQTFMPLWTKESKTSRIQNGKIISLIQLCLLRGAIGKPGCGPLILTGQPSAKGGWKVGGMVSLFASLYDFKKSDRRKEVCKLWGCKPIQHQVATSTLSHIVEALEAKKIKLLWMVGVDPVREFHDPQRMVKALKQAEVVVVQDSSAHSASLPYADVVLPSAVWLEKEGTFSNSERRISRLKRYRKPPEDVLADTDIFLRFTAAMGWTKSFLYEDLSQLFLEFAMFSKQQRADLSGVSYKRLEKSGSLLWPCPGKKVQTTRLYENKDFATPRGKARLIGTDIEKNYPEKNISPSLRMSEAQFLNAERAYA